MSYEEQQAKLQKLVAQCDDESDNNGQSEMDVFSSDDSVHDRQFHPEEPKLDSSDDVSDVEDNTLPIVYETQQQHM